MSSHVCYIYVVYRRDTMGLQGYWFEGDLFINLVSLVGKHHIPIQYYKFIRIMHYTIIT